VDSFLLTTLPILLFEGVLLVISNLLEFLEVAHLEPRTADPRESLEEVLHPGLYLEPHSLTLEVVVPEVVVLVVAVPCVAVDAISDLPRVPTVMELY